MIDETSDGRLLSEYLAGDAAAFERLARRHGALVLSACRRLLGAGGDAEDAAQATFLVLIRKAVALTGERDVGHWLHRTALLVSRNALRARRRQARHEKEAVHMRSSQGADPIADRAWQEAARQLDGALDALPAAQRQTLLLCYFEGLSQSQAAERLGLPEGTVAARCARGIERLRSRLGVREQRLGTAGLAALLLAHASGPGTAPEPLISSVAAAAKGATAGAPVLALAEGAMKAMFWMKAKMVAAAVAAVAVLGAGTPLALRAASAENAAPAPAANPAPAAAPTQPAEAPRANEPVAVDGIKVTLAADKAEAKAGEEIKLTLTFENVSKEKLRVFWPVERFLADQVSLQAVGDGVLSGPQIRNMMAFIPSLANYPELAPGEKKALEIKITGNPPSVGRLATYFTKEGSYKLRISYAYNEANPVLHGLEDNGTPVPGKVWTGKVQSQELEIKLTGEFKPAPQRGLMRPGGRLPGPQVRPMGQGMKVPEELMPDRNPQPAPGILEAM